MIPAAFDLIGHVWLFLTCWLGVAVQAAGGWIIMMGLAERAQLDRLARWGPMGSSAAPAARTLTSPP